MVKIYIDAGHGGTDNGASGNGLKEKDLTLAISNKINDKLKGYENATVYMSRTTDKTLSLKQRTDDANSKGVDYLLSVHINSGGENGFESYIHNSLSAQSKTSKLRTTLHNGIMKAIGGNDRGKKSANFHMLRESQASACLTENLFIDTKGDADKLKSNAFLDKVAQGHVDGLASALGLKKKSGGKETEKATGKQMYRVVTGSYKKRKYAKSRVTELKKKKFESFITTFKKGNSTFYRVVTGSFEDKKNADARMKSLKKKGYDSFITNYKG